jgi:hypothetical protein
MIKIKINETARFFLKGELQIFNKFTISCNNEKEVIEYLINRYGKLPKGKRKIYIDIIENNYDIKETKEIGFLHSFWNDDLSHNSKKWFQTDWITFDEVTEKPINYKKILNKG